LLVNHFIRKHSALQNKIINGIDEDALKFLLDHEYNGNIRELENFIERGVALAIGQKISISDIRPNFIEYSENNIINNSNLIPVYFGEKLADIERRVIERTLEMVGNKQIEAARILGITDRTIRNKINLYNSGK
jgi:two-component system response regulator AtoC